MEDVISKTQEVLPLMNTLESILEYPEESIFSFQSKTNNSKKDICLVALKAPQGWQLCVIEI